MRKCKFFVSLAVSILLVVSFTTCSNGNQSNGKTLTGLEISAPVDTDYIAGQFFSKNDLVVTATYSNKKLVDVTDKCKFWPTLTTPLTTSDTDIEISYTEDGFTLKAYHGIIVRNPPEGGLLITGVTVSPSTVPVQKGTSFTFNAIVEPAEASQAVTWTVTGGGAGTSIVNGFLTVAAGETAKTLTVRAASAVPGYTSIFGTATVTVTSETVVGGPTVVTVTGVTVSPSTINMTKGGTQQFQAAVTGDNSPSQTVTWTVQGGGAGTSISTGGLLTVGGSETATTLTVRAASTVAGYTNIAGTAIVTVASPPAQGAVVVSPATITVVRGGTQQFSVTIAGVAASNTDVVWEIPDNPWSIPGIAGTTSISASGLLTVWAGDGSSSFTVKATSKADPTMFGTAAVTLP